MVCISKVVTLILALSVSLAACTPAWLSQVKQQVERHQASLLTDPELSVLKSKVWFKVDKDIPTAYLFLDGKPEESEKPAIRRFYELQQKQVNFELDALRRNNELEYYSIASSGYAQYMDGLMNLYLGKMTYGEFNRLTKSVDELMTTGVLQKRARDDAAFSASMQQLGQSYTAPLESYLEQSQRNLGVPARGLWQVHQNGRTYQCSQFGTQVMCQ